MNSNRKSEPFFSFRRIDVGHLIIGINITYYTQTQNTQNLPFLRLALCCFPFCPKKWWAGLLKFGPGMGDKSGVALHNLIVDHPSRSRTLNAQINIWALAAMSFYFWAFFTFFNTFTRRKVPSDQSLVISENCVHSLRTQTSWSCWIEGAMFERWSNVSVRPGPDPRRPEARRIRDQDSGIFDKKTQKTHGSRKWYMPRNLKFGIKVEAIFRFISRPCHSYCSR